MDLDYSFTITESIAGTHFRRSECFPKFGGTKDSD
jgi:hypothetical protein